MTNGRLKKGSEIANNLIVSLALIIGGIWAVYKFYIFTRPSIVISHRCQHVKQNDGRTFVRLYVEIINKGTATKTFKQDPVSNRPYEYLMVWINDLGPSEKELKVKGIKDGSVEFSLTVSDDISGKEGIFKLLEYVKMPLTVPITPEATVAWNFNFLIPKNVKAISTRSGVYDEELKVLVGNLSSSIYHLE